MARKYMALVIVVIMMTLATLDLPGCGSEDDGKHCRIYLVEDTAGEDFTSLHVVESPSNGDWGSNLIFTEEEEYINGNWRVFRFPSGPFYDMKLEYRIEDIPDTLEETAQQCLNGTGVKYDVDAGYLFTTTFTFD